MFSERRTFSSPPSVSLLLLYGAVVFDFLKLITFERREVLCGIFLQPAKRVDKIKETLKKKQKNNKDKGRRGKEMRKKSATNEARKAHSG